jgi:hypothetical protein
MAFEFKNVPSWGGSAQYSLSGRKPQGIKGILKYMRDALSPGGIPGLETVQAGGSISQRWTGVTPRANPAYDGSVTTGPRRNPLGPPRGPGRGGRRRQGTGGVRSVLRPGG